MRQNRSITLALAVVLGFAISGVSARAQDQPAAPAANSDQPKQPASTNPPPQQPARDADKPQQPATKPAAANDAPQSTTPGAGGSSATSPNAAQAAAPKPAAKAHHVITNEDIEAQHEQMASANSDVDIGNINDCDSTCFDWVRNSTNYYVVRNSDWKRDLLHGIEQVTEDTKWQAALYQIARLKSKFCDLNQDKNDALADMADPRKMTEDEIAIDEAYDRKFEAAQSDLNAAYANADSVMRSYSGVVVAFMSMQKQRAGNRGCVIRYPVMYRGYRAPVDDPYHP
jgi:hypothetical protein